MLPMKKERSAFTALAVSQKNHILEALQPLFEIDGSGHGSPSQNRTTKMPHRRVQL
jgi:hypothetical protein